MNQREDLLPPAETGLSKDAVSRYTKKLADIFEFKPGGDIFELVKKLHGKIEYQTPSEFLANDGSIIVEGPNDFTIYLPNYTGNLRDRFTIAHELGHYFLHSKAGLSKLRATRNMVSERSEWEANWFAAELLMPRKEFMANLGKNNSDLATYFGVSEKAVEVRRQSLGISA